MTRYEFRQATSIYDLHEIFQFRYKTYRAEGMEGFIKESPFKIDVDEWDPYSKHYGLYNFNGIKEILVGCVRVVYPTPSAQTELIKKAYAKHFAFHEIDIIKTPRTTLPLMSYYPGTEAAVAKLQHLNIGKNICEASRLMLKKDHRSLGLSRFLIECVIAATYFMDTQSIAIFSCRASHTRLYKIYSCEILEGTKEAKLIGKASGLWCVLLMRKSEISDHWSDKFQQMGHQLKAIGLISHTPKNNIQKSAA